MDRDLFVRSKANPIINPQIYLSMLIGVLNPGVAVVDEEIVLLLRIENRRGISGLYVARSANGSVDGWRIEEQALLEPRLAEYPYEKWGCEDPACDPNRPTHLDDCLHSLFTIWARGGTGENGGLRFCRTTWVGHGAQ